MNIQSVPLLRLKTSLNPSNKQILVIGALGTCAIAFVGWCFYCRSQNYNARHIVSQQSLDKGLVYSTAFHLFFNPLKPSMQTSAITFAQSKKELDQLIASGAPTHTGDSIYFPQNSLLLDDYIKSLPNLVWIRDENHTQHQRMLLINSYMHAYRTCNEQLMKLLDDHAKKYRVAIPRLGLDEKGNKQLPTHPGMLRQPETKEEFETALAVMKKYCTCTNKAKAEKLHTTRLLFQSLLFGKEEMVSYAIKKGVDLNAVDPALGAKPIIYAAVHLPHLPFIKQAVGLGAKVTRAEVRSAGITNIEIKTFLEQSAS